MSDPAVPKDEASPKKGGRKWLIITVAAAVLLAGGGAGAFYAFYGDGQDPEVAAAKAAEKRKAARVFVTLEPFVVNLADRDADRYVQVGVVLEVEGKEVESRIAAKMPAVRNEILLLISSKVATDLTTRDGKQSLASEIALASARPLGWTPPADPPEADAPTKVKTKDGGADKGKDAKAKARPKKAEEPAPNPVAAVHFASFIVQ